MAWFACAVLVVGSFKYLIEGVGLIFESWSFKKARFDLKEVSSHLLEIQELLSCGCVPTEAQWKALDQISEPWRKLVTTSLSELRAAGASLLPTLKRLRGLVGSHLDTLTFAHARASQPFAQALICSFFVPILGISFYSLMPGLSEQFSTWLLACILAWLLTGVGALWLIHLASSARWGGMAGEKRSWILGAQCGGEKFLALIRSGTPPDLAWIQVCQFLESVAPGLAQMWGSSVWSSQSYRGKNSSEELLVEAGLNIKKSVQVSLMEGRPCGEKIETCLVALQRDMHAHMEKQLSLLANRALKPLFFCVAPALLSLLAFGLYLGAQDSLKDLGDVF